MRKDIIVRRLIYVLVALVVVTSCKNDRTPEGSNAAAVGATVTSPDTKVSSQLLYWLAEDGKIYEGVCTPGRPIAVNNCQTNKLWITETDFNQTIETNKMGPSLDTLVVDIATVDAQLAAIDAKLKANPQDQISQDNRVRTQATRDSLTAAKTKADVFRAMLSGLDVTTFDLNSGAANTEATTPFVGWVEAMRNVFRNIRIKAVKDESLERIKEGKLKWDACRDGCTSDYGAYCGSASTRRMAHCINFLTECYRKRCDPAFDGLKSMETTLNEKAVSNIP
jgi:hypothetical protein